MPDVPGACEWQTARYSLAPNCWSRSRIPLHRPMRDSLITAALVGCDTHQAENFGNPGFHRDAVPVMLVANHLAQRLSRHLIRRRDGSDFGEPSRRPAAQATELMRTTWHCAVALAHVAYMRQTILERLWLERGHPSLLDLKLRSIQPECFSRRSTGGRQ